MNINLESFAPFRQPLESAFRASGVFQLAKTGPLVTENFPLLRLFLSDAMMARKFYTPYDINCTNLYILTMCGMSHILTRIGQFQSWRKNFVCTYPKPKLENYK